MFPDVSAQMMAGLRCRILEAKPLISAAKKEKAWALAYAKSIGLERRKFIRHDGTNEKWKQLYKKAKPKWAYKVI